MEQVPPVALDLIGTGPAAQDQLIRELDGRLEVLARYGVEVHDPLKHQRDPPAALDWVASLPPGEENGQVLRATLQGWWQLAPEDAEAWVRSRTPDAALDIALHVLIEDAAEDPSAALGWALRLHDAEDKLRTSLMLARRWGRRDSEALEAWLATNELPRGLEAAIRSWRPTRGQGAVSDRAPVPVRTGSAQ